MEKLIRLDEQAKARVMDTLDYMTKHPETGYRETLCSAYMEMQFKELGYEPILAGDIPGFYVTVDTGREGPTVLVLGELDAIKCAGHPEADPQTHAVHACGHNAQSAALVGVAAALKNEELLGKLSGKIMLCAVPAEEMIEPDFRRGLAEKGVIKYYTGKPEFLRRGYFDSVDIAFMVHTSLALACQKGAVGIISKIVTYKGKAAHAGGAPQNGINALYAATQGLAAVNAIRETFTENDLVRVHPIMTDGGTVVNGIPDIATIETYVRAKTYEAMENINRRVNRAFIGAALSMGAEIQIDDSPGYAPLKNDQNMIDVAARAATVAYPDTEFLLDNGYSTGSTDMGDLSMIFPSVHPYAPGASGTTHGADYKIEDADLACVKCAEWQVMMLFLLLSDSAKEAKRIKEEFEPTFESKEQYFEYIERFLSNADRISYTEKGADILI